MTESNEDERAGGDDGQQQKPPEGEGKGKGPTSKEKLLEEIHKRVEEAKPLQEESIALHRRADEAAASDNPQEAEQLRAQAKELDKQASRLLKTAERLQAGWVQGGAMGGGIGVGVAGGLGATVGAVVSGLTAIPTAGLGVLIGAGTGLVHGPWVKFTEAFSKEESDDIVGEAEAEARRVADES